MSLAGVMVADRCGVYLLGASQLGRCGSDIGSNDLRKSICVGWQRFPMWALPPLHYQHQEDVVSSDTTGSELEDGQLLRDLDVRRLKIACTDYVHGSHTPRLEAQRLTRLAQTLTRGDSALEDQILRRWGVR